MRGTMVNKIKETFQRHTSRQDRTRRVTYKIDHEVLDLPRAEQLEVRVARRLD